MENTTEENSPTTSQIFTAERINNQSRGRFLNNGRINGRGHFQKGNNFPRNNYNRGTYNNYRENNRYRGHNNNYRGNPGNYRGNGRGRFQNRGSFSHRGEFNPNYGMFWTEHMPQLPPHMQQNIHQPQQQNPLQQIPHQRYIPPTQQPNFL